MKYLQSESRVSADREALALDWRNGVVCRYGLACLIGLLMWLPGRELAAQGRGPSPVLAAEVYDAEVHPTQEFVGTVVPTRQAIIGSAVDGRVVEFNVNEGDRVEAGDTLAQLLTETIKLDLVAAEAELELRNAELTELLNGNRVEEIGQTRALRDVAKARAELANKKLERVRKLGDAVSDDELDSAVADAATAAATLTEREEALKLMEAGARPERIAQAKARVAAAEAQVKKLDDQIRKHTIISRFAGYVAAERTEVGEWVSRGDPVAEVVALDEVDVLLYVLESYAAHIQLEMSVGVKIPALSSLGEEVVPPRLPGKVMHVTPRADERSRTIPVKVRVSNIHQGKTPLMKAGMLARATLPTGPRRMARLVPKDALVLSGQAKSVWVVSPKAGADGLGNVRPVPVETGIASEALVEVIGEALRPGDLVVTEGNERLRPGAEVKLVRVIRPDASKGEAETRQARLPHDGTP